MIQDADPAAACERIRRHLDRGAPWDACDVFREAIEASPFDAELLYCGALAQVRSGASHAAHVLLDRAQAAEPSAHRLSEIRSLRGRLWKDAYHRASGNAAALAERARSEYLAAYAAQHDAFPGINAATLSFVLGDRSTAQRLAKDILARLEASKTSDFWDLATAGEA